VLSGPLGGALWIMRSGINANWLGTYELEKQKALVRALRQGHVFFDIGANVGFYTLLGSRRVGPAGQVHAFEPLPQNVRLLKQHVDMNRCRNVRVHEVAIGGTSGVVAFAQGDDSFTGRVGDSGELQVCLRTLDSLVVSGTVPMPQIVKMDIEGGEYEALLGAEYVLRTGRPLVFLATHSLPLREACIAQLERVGYATRRLSANESESPEDELIAEPT
jgi:FkbM family methyltransferase